MWKGNDKAKQEAYALPSVLEIYAVWSYMSSGVSPNMAGPKQIRQRGKSHKLTTQEAYALMEIYTVWSYTVSSGESPNMAGPKQRSGNVEKATKLAQEAYALPSVMEIYTAWNYMSSGESPNMAGPEQRSGNAEKTTKLVHKKPAHCHGNIHCADYMSSGLSPNMADSFSRHLGSFQVDTYDFPQARISTALVLPYSWLILCHLTPGAVRYKDANSKTH
jgi:hypothetical protein